MILNTCNRTEIYYVSNTKEDLQKIKDWVRKTKGLSQDILEEEAYTMEGGEAVQHLYRVISGLDSMVLGESEVAGQVKEAYYQSHRLGGTGKFLNKLFHSAFDLNKQIRNETAIGKRRISVAKVAVQAAEKKLGDLRNRQAMVIGAGEMGKQVLKFLLEAGIGKAYVANRTMERSRRLTEELGGEALTFDDRFRLMAKVDLIISATGCHRYLIRREDLVSIKRSSPLYCIDISVPRSIDPQVKDYEFCHLLDIDDLKELAEQESEQLRGAIGEAESIIRSAAADFASWLRVQEVIPLIEFMQQRVEGIRQEELKKLNSHLLKEHGDQLERFSKRLVNKLLHHHMTALKEAAREGRNGYADVVRSIFRAGPHSVDLKMKRDKIARVQEDLTLLDRRLLNILQLSLPLVERPFAKIGEELKMTEEKVMERVNKLKSKGIIRQISAIFDSSKLGYKSALVAAQVDKSQIDQVAKIINRHPGVSHNYERNHSFNLWFTITVPPQANLEETVAKLVGEIGNAIRRYRLLPALKTFKIQVMLDMEVDKGEVKPKPQSRSKPKGFRAEWGPLTEADKALIRELQKDLQIIERPFAKIAERLGISQAELFKKIRAMKRAGMIRRFAAILRHRNAGFRANGMVCWRVPEERIEEVGQIAAAVPQVSHCYQRPTYPDWPYNLFTMLHARDEEGCQQIAEEISRETGITGYEILFSTKEYKKTRVKYFV